VTIPFPVCAVLLVARSLMEGESIGKRRLPPRLRFVAPSSRVRLSLILRRPPWRRNSNKD